MRRFAILLLIMATLTACHESIEDKAERQAREYTRKNCPTPVTNSVRTDSITFDKATREYTYYCSFTDKMDNTTMVNQYRNAIHQQLTEAIKQSTSIMAFKDAGFIIVYKCRSASNPKQMLYTDRFEPKDYKTHK